MDPIKNPFSPGAGSPPPELVGRGSALEQARILLGRIKQKRSEKSMVLTELRGVGKTVLLIESNGWIWLQGQSRRNRCLNLQAWCCIPNVHRQHRKKPHGRELFL